MFNFNLGFLDDILKGMKAAGGDVNAAGGGVTTTPRDPNQGIAVDMNGGEGGGANPLGAFFGSLFGGGSDAPTPAESGGKVSVGADAPQAQGSGIGDFLGNLFPDSSDDTKEKAKIMLDFFGNLSAASAPSEMPNSFLGALGKAGKGISASLDERSSAASNDAFRKAQSKRWEQESDPAYQHRTAMIAKGYVQDPDGTWSRAAGLQAEEDRVAEREAATAAANDARDHSNALEIERVREDARVARDERNAANKPMSATDKKALWSSEDEIVDIDNSIAALNRAIELNNGGNLYSGFGAESKSSWSSKLPGFLVPDELEEAGKLSQEYSNLVGNHSVATLKDKFGGSPSDGERIANKELAASLGQNQEVRATILATELRNLEAYRRQKMARAEELRGQQGGTAAPGAIERAPLPELPAGNVPTISDPNDPWLRDPRNKGRQFRTPDGRLKNVP